MKKKRRLQRADVGWLSAVGFLVLLQFWWLPGDPGTPDDSFSNAIEGKRGLYLTLDRLSQRGLLPPVRRETGQLVPEQSATLLLLGPERYPDDHEQQRLYEFVVQGGSLVLAPNWQRPDFSMAALGVEVNREYFREEDTIAGPASNAAPPAPGAPPIDAPGESLPAERETEATPENPGADRGSGRRKPISAAKRRATLVAVQTDRDAALQSEPDQVLEKSVNPDSDRLSPPGSVDPPDNRDQLPRISHLRTGSQLIDYEVPWRTRASISPRFSSEVLVKTGQGTVQAAAWWLGAGMVVLSASSDVFSNRAMLDPEQAELAVRLITYAADHQESRRTGRTPPIIVNEFLNVSQSYRGTAVLLSPSLRSGTLQLITIALLAGWLGFHRFGPPCRTTADQRRSLTESAIAVGNLQFRTESGSEMVRAYLDFARTQLRQLFGPSVRLNDTRRIALHCGLEEEEVQRRLHAAEASLQENVTPGRAAVLIRDLADLLNRLSGRT